MSIEYLLFDLDNTLYPATSAMDAGITKRMLECVASFFNCDFETAAKIRSERYKSYSTTLEWLRSEGFTDIDGFMTHVHPDNETDELAPQPELREFLLSINLPKSILTNAPKIHAQRVLKHFNIEDCFESVTDIKDADYCGKPYPQAFEAALKKTGSSVKNTLFLDDMMKYTDGWNALGGTACLVGEKNGTPLNPDSKIYDLMPGIPGGKTHHINTIYQLPELLKTL